jgi:Ca2+-binding RTX toxin-like protein
VASGADQADVLLGDNGVIDRPGTDDPNTGDAVRSVSLHDVEVIGSTTPPVGTRGDDALTGDGDADQLLGQGGDDVLSGDGDDDYAEGGPGADRLFGADGHDDLVGGSSTTADGVVRRTGTPARLATRLADGADVLDGGAGEDVLSGDNATVVRQVAGDGVWTRHGNPFGHPRRLVGVNAPDPARAFGDDVLRGADGADELHGQLGSDRLEGAAGDDVLVGDLAKVTPTVLAGPARDLAAGGFVLDRVDVPGSLRRDVELLDFEQGGADVLVGGLGNDALHGGAAADRMNGEGTLVGTGDQGAAAKLAALDAACATDRRACDLDALFGGEGDDRMWGGPQRDHLYGGHGADHLDVIAGGGNPLTDFKGVDVLFGGWGRDAMQADVSRPSPNGEDKLIDTAGAYNAYYVCESAYGGNSILRLISPDMLVYLQQLAVSDGAPRAEQSGTSGFRELSMIYSGDVKSNSGSPYPGGLGSGTCG